MTVGKVPGKKNFVFGFPGRGRGAFGRIRGMFGAWSGRFWGVFGACSGRGRDNYFLFLFKFQISIGQGWGPVEPSRAPALAN